MPFVKLDCGILDSTLWMDRSAREVFITALLMALPGEVTTPTPQLTVRSLRKTGWMVPPGWYGLIPAAGSGIIRRAGVKASLGLDALERLGEPEEGSRTPEFGGRRLVRIDGGYIVLNFMRYREHDETAAARMRRYRQRRKEESEQVTRNNRHVTSRSDVAVADAEAEADKTPKRTKETVYPKKWLLPFGKAWQVRCGESIPWERLEASLFPLCQKFKCTPVLTAFRGYLNDTEPRYASPARFAATSAQWGLGNGGPSKGPHYPTADEADRAAGIKT